MDWVMAVGTWSHEDSGYSCFLRNLGVGLMRTHSVYIMIIITRLLYSILSFHTTSHSFLISYL